MGAAGSVEYPLSIISTPVSSNTSGYESTRENTGFDEQSGIGETSDILHDLKSKSDIKMASPKKQLHTRPSGIIRYVEKKEQDQELELEKNLLEKTPALKKVLNGFDEVSKFVNDLTKRKSQYFGQLHKLLHDKVVDLFSSKYTKDEERTVMANKLARIKFVEPVIAWYDFVMDELDIESVQNAFIDEVHRFDEEPPSDLHVKDGYLVILEIRELLWNYSDSSHRFSMEIAKPTLKGNTTFLSILVKDLNCIFEDEFKDMELEESGEHIFAFDSAVGILHNCARNPDIEKSVFRDIHTLEALSPFLKSQSVYVKMVTLLALCNMVTEQEVSNLATDNNVVSFLTDAISRAINAKDRKEHGFHLTELVDGLASMAQSDSNKGLIMERDSLTMTMKILDSARVSESETLACVKLLWELAFAQEAKKQMKQKQDLMKKLDKLKESTNSEIKRAARSVSFLLVGKDERLGTEGKVSIDSKKKAPLVAGISGADIQAAGKHIMISYCWGDKEMVLRIYQQLKEAGFKIWIDVADMGGYMDLLDGMARAVEDAYMILICYSEKYKNSQNCRTEADYVYARKMRFIPVKMQRGYSPDGWLGILIGARLYIEFSGHYPFAEKFSELRDRIKKEVPPDGDREIAGPPSTTGSHKSTTAVAPGPSPGYKEWSRDDVLKWLKENKIDGSNFKKVKLLTGAHLHYLKSVQEKSPSTFYVWLETKLDLKNLDDIMKFDEALQELR